jgi:hypothetical protein
MPAARPTRSGEVRHQLSDILQVESEVWWAGCLRGEAADGIGARERPPHTAVCRLVPGERHCVRPTKGVSDRALRDCAHRATRILLNDPSKLACFSLLEGHPCWSKCGRRTRTLHRARVPEHRINVGVIPSPSSWGRCEQRGHLAAPFSVFQSSSSIQRVAGRSSIARVERAHSYRARSASRRMTRLVAPTHPRRVLLTVRGAIKLPDAGKIALTG